MNESQPLPTTSSAPPKPTPPKGHSKHSKAWMEAVAQQGKIMSAMDVLMGDLQQTTDASKRARTAASLALLSKSWDVLENRKRVLRGRGLPGIVRPRQATHPAKLGPLATLALARPTKPLPPAA